MVARYHQPGRRRSARHGRRGTPRGPPSGPVSASWRDIVAAEAPEPLTGMVKPLWLVTCSCGWSRECQEPSTPSRSRSRRLTPGPGLGSRLYLPRRLRNCRRVSSISARSGRATVLLHVPGGRSITRIVACGLCCRLSAHRAHSVSRSGTQSDMQSQTSAQSRHSWW